MKKIVFIFWLLMPCVAFAILKADSGIHLDRIPPNGISLDQGWKFHPGDNEAWVAPAYNDDTWQTINPADPIYYLPQVQKAQIGWFRLDLHVGKALRGKTVAFVISQIGASEIYLNGELILKYGKVSSNYYLEQTYDPRGQPLTIQLANKPEQVLAIRYSYTKQNLYNGYGPSVLSILVSQPTAASDNFNDNINESGYRALVFGVFIILSILHLFIYLSYHNRRINLYLSIYTFFEACAFANGILGSWHGSNAKFFIDSIFLISAPLAQIFLLLTVYDLFGQPKKLWFKLLVLLCILVIPFEFWRDFGSKNLILDPFGILIYVEIIRVSIIAFRRKQQGAALFFVGQSIGLIFFCSFVYIYNQPLTFKLIEIDIAFLIPAVVISILLAREFAQNNISLKQQLDEVKKLSEKSLAQELEKQQLLASQNEMLEKQVEKRTNELSQSLANLKQTQSQLIQSEKMASLGELTAGIAHEIQNPLNFVNNFSEVNTELLAELKQEISAKNYEEVSAIADDIIGNEQKINMHGKRADAIVKGMLQHSQSGAGTKEPTNLNALADECMRLAYHGLKAKDKSFNSVPIAIGMVTHLDESLPLVNVIPQDMVRVMLNLFNNAFYAMNQKQKTAGADYKPAVEVETFYLPIQGVGGLKVKDNGIGIPDAIREKIMQPFFTTKPTGEGTGLGLSLTYDMVVKGHGGSIQVNSVEGEGSEFTIQLPIETGN